MAAGPAVQNPVPGLVPPPQPSTPVCRCSVGVAWRVVPGAGAGGGWEAGGEVHVEQPVSAVPWFTRRSGPSFPMGRRTAVVSRALCSSAGSRRGCGAGGAARAQQAGSPSCGWWSSSAPRLPRVAAPVGPGWADWGLASGDRRGRRGRPPAGSPPPRAAAASVVCDLLSSVRAVRDGRRARAVAKCVGVLAAAGAVPSHTAGRRSTGARPPRRGGLRRGHTPRPL